MIPKDARQIFGVKPGDTLLILGDEETGIIVTKPDVLRDAADDRLCLALCLLQREAANRQMLLFTCQSRERRCLSADG